MFPFEHLRNLKTRFGKNFSETVRSCYDKVTIAITTTDFRCGLALWGPKAETIRYLHANRIVSSRTVRVHARRTPTPPPTDGDDGGKGKDLLRILCVQKQTSLAPCPSNRVYYTMRRLRSRRRFIVVFFYFFPICVWRRRRLVQLVRILLWRRLVVIVVLRCDPWAWERRRETNVIPRRFRNYHRTTTVRCRERHETSAVFLSEKNEHGVFRRLAQRSYLITSYRINNTTYRFTIYYVGDHYFVHELKTKNRRFHVGKTKAGRVNDFFNSVKLMGSNKKKLKVSLIFGWKVKSYATSQTI